jgi:hypothetical protein
MNSLCTTNQLIYGNKKVLYIYNPEHCKIIKMNEILKHVSMLWEHYVKGKNNDTKYHQFYSFIFDVQSRWTQSESEVFQDLR